MIYYSKMDLSLKKLIEQWTSDFHVEVANIKTEDEWIYKHMTPCSYFFSSIRQT